jgi:Rap1a immunity proteins
MLQGYCTGVIASIYWLGRDHLGICAPRESNIGQAIRVVVTYIDARPARMHENFMALTHEALQKAWPCRR